VELAAIRVGLRADLGAAHAAGGVVFRGCRQHKKEGLPNWIGPLASGAENARRFELAKAVFHIETVDHPRNWPARPSWKDRKTIASRAIAR
jgi:hypothetical protein